MAGCGCKKNNQQTVTETNTVTTQNQTSMNDVQQNNIIDDQQVDLLVKKIEQINNSLEQTK
jgi:hypothetical protein